MESATLGTNKPIYKKRNRLMEHREQICSLPREKGRGRRRVNWESGVSKCKLLHLEWVNICIAQGTIRNIL